MKDLLREYDMSRSGYGIWLMPNQADSVWGDLLQPIAVVPSAATFTACLNRLGIRRPFLDCKDGVMRFDKG